MSGGVISAVLERPDQYSTPLTASGQVVIEINRSCGFTSNCNLGITDLYGNCYEPFASPANLTIAVSISGATLNFANFDNAWIPDSDLSDTTLSNATFTGANLQGVNFRNAVMIKTDFSGADMTDAQVDGAFVYQTIAPNGQTVNDANSLLKNQ